MEQWSSVNDVQHAPTHERQPMIPVRSVTLGPHWPSAVMVIAGGKNATLSRAVSAECGADVR
jgi:hypothetical protein